MAVQTGKTTIAPARGRAFTKTALDTLRARWEGELTRLGFSRITKDDPLRACGLGKKTTGQVWGRRQRNTHTFTVVRFGPDHLLSTGLLRGEGGAWVMTRDFSEVETYNPEVDPVASMVEWLGGDVSSGGYVWRRCPASSGRDTWRRYVEEVPPLRVLKFGIHPPPNGESVEVTMPAGPILMVKEDAEGTVLLWASETPSQTFVVRTFQLFGTGHYGITPRHHHVGSYTAPDGFHIGHLYEVL